MDLEREGVPLGMSQDSNIFQELGNTTNQDSMDISGLSNGGTRYHCTSSSHIYGTYPLIYTQALYDYL